MVVVGADGSSGWNVQLSKNHVRSVVFWFSSEGGVVSSSGRPGVVSWSPPSLGGVSSSGGGVVVVVVVVVVVEVVVAVQKPFPGAQLLVPLVDDELSQNPFTLVSNQASAGSLLLSTVTPTRFMQSMY